MDWMRIALFSCTAAIYGGFAAQYALFWWQGFAEESYKPIASVFLIFCACLSLAFVLLVLWCLSLILRKKRLEATIAFALIFLPVGLSALFHPSKMLVKGLHDRLVRDYSTEDLRAFARELHQMATAEKKDLFSPEELARLKFSKPYGFLSWIKLGTQQGPSYISTMDGVVQVWWGGGLSGRWGFTVSIDGAFLESAEEPDGFERRLAPDIMVVFE